MRLYLPVETNGYSLTHPRGFKSCLRKMIDRIKYGIRPISFSTSSGETLREMTSVIFKYDKKTKDIVVTVKLMIPGCYYCNDDILLGGVHNKSTKYSSTMKIKIGR